MTAALEVIGLDKRYGGLHVTRAVSLTIAPGEILAVIGPNGAGKTTLIGQICGDVAPDAGTVHVAGRDVTKLPAAARINLGLSRSFQITQLAGTLSVADNMLLACAAEMGKAWSLLSPARSDGQLAATVTHHLAQANLEARANISVANLSHGERKQLELALALAARPSTLLLDEPMAGLGVAESEAMVKRIQALKGGPGILLVEHDMAAVFALADRILVLAEGAVIASGTPAEIRLNPDVKRVYLGE
jgi:branched-chain amino acid transport system ATP-binding protein